MPTTPNQATAVYVLSLAFTSSMVRHPMLGAMIVDEYGEGNVISVMHLQWNQENRDDTVIEYFRVNSRVSGPDKGIVVGSYRPGTRAWDGADRTRWHEMIDIAAEREVRLLDWLIWTDTTVYSMGDFDTDVLGEPSRWRWIRAQGVDR